MTAPVRLLFDHLAWADRRTLGALESAPEVPERAVGLFAHVLAAEHVWLSRIRGEEPALPVWPSLDLPACTALAGANADGFSALLDSLDAEGLERRVAYRNSAGQAFESRVVEMLLQVATHGCYHRGQVALLLRDAGAEPAATDLIAFVRGVPAAVRQG